MFLGHLIPRLASLFACSVLDIHIETDLYYDARLMIYVAQNHVFSLTLSHAQSLVEITRNYFTIYGFFADAQGLVHLPCAPNAGR